MATDERDDLDGWLDAGLATYAEAEPLAGMEERVLRRVREAGRPRRSRAWMWGAALAACAALAWLMAVLPHGTDRPARPVVASVAPPVETRNATPVPVVQPPVRTVRRPAARSMPDPLPRRDQFPSPSPLTAEERALLTLVTRHPEQAAELVAAEVPRQPLEPIRIEEVRIEPLSDGN